MLGLSRVSQAQAETFSNSPVLSNYQLKQNFANLRFGMFIHFNLGTFTNQEWALPNQNPNKFNPTGVHPTQWANAAKSAGMTFAVLTTKHHDGFALWPTKYGKKNNFGTYQNVMSSQYPHDIVKMYVDSFRAVGVTPCLYFSIWDRTEGIVAGATDSGAITPAQMATITGELTELLTNYGTIPLIMFDGWTWMAGRQQVAYQTIRDTVKALQPNILICDHNGLTQPFEEDILNFEHFNVPASNTFVSTQGNKIYGSGWFWHTASFNNGAGNGGVKSASSIGGMLKGTTEPVWCNYLLDCPPDTNGVIESDITSQLSQVPKYWTPNTGRKALPDPGPVLEYPVTPVGITASSMASTANKPYWAIDGHSDWVSGAEVEKVWKSAAVPSVASPQWLDMDLGQVYPNISMLEYMPDQARSTGNDITTVTNKASFVTGYNIYVSTDNKTFTKVAAGTFPATGLIHPVTFSPVPARYVKFEITATSGNVAAVVDEIDIGRSCAGKFCTTELATPRSALPAFATCRNLPTGGIGIEAQGAFGYRVLSIAGGELEDGTGQDRAVAGRGLRPGVYLVQVHSALHGDQTVKILRN
jgi:alpha-L-fucosidase